MGLGTWLDEWGPALRLEWWTLLDTKETTSRVQVSQIHLSLASVDIFA